jgi:flagellar protein FliS
VEQTVFNNPYAQHSEIDLLTATPLQLTVALYEGAMDCVRDARRYLASGEVMERSRAIGKAMNIVVELQASLDMENGGEFSQRLASLYQYIQKRLLEAQAQKSDAALEEVLGLLMTMAGGWRGAAAELARVEQEAAPVEVQPEPVPAFAGSSFAYGYGEAAQAYGSHSYSF